MDKLDAGVTDVLLLHEEWMSASGKRNNALATPAVVKDNGRPAELAMSGKWRVASCGLCQLWNEGWAE